MPYHWEVCQMTVIKTSGSDEINNCPDNHLHDVIHFNDLQHNASWCEIQCNVQNSRSPLTTCTFSLNFVAIPTCFFPDHWWRAICSNTDSTGPVYSDPIQHSNERAENTIGCCGTDHRHQPQELLSRDPTRGDGGGNAPGRHFSGGGTFGQKKE